MILEDLLTVAPSLYLALSKDLYRRGIRRLYHTIRFTKNNLPKLLYGEKSANDRKRTALTYVQRVEFTRPWRNFTASAGFGAGGGPIPSIMREISFGNAGDKAGLTGVTEVCFTADFVQHGGILFEDTAYARDIRPFRPLILSIAIPPTLPDSLSTSPESYLAKKCMMVIENALVMFTGYAGMKQLNLYMASPPHRQHNKEQAPRRVRVDVVVPYVFSLDYPVLISALPRLIHESSEPDFGARWEAWIESLRLPSGRDVVGRYTVSVDHGVEGWGKDEGEMTTEDGCYEDDWVKGNGNQAMIPQQQEDEEEGWLTATGADGVVGEAMINEHRVTRDTEGQAAADTTGTTKPLPQPRP
ncbi:hypothetical protein IAT38_002316 [Cryptococcus sp. DSM 104549]